MISVFEVSFLLHELDVILILFIIYINLSYFSRVKTIERFSICVRRILLTPILVFWGSLSWIYRGILYLALCWSWCDKAVEVPGWQGFEETLRRLCSSCDIWLPVHPRHPLPPASRQPFATHQVANYHLQDTIEMRETSIKYTIYNYFAFFLLRI